MTTTQADQRLLAQAAARKRATAAAVTAALHAAHPELADTHAGHAPGDILVLTWVDGPSVEQVTAAISTALDDCQQRTLHRTLSRHQRACAYLHAQAEGHAGWTPASAGWAGVDAWNSWNGSPAAPDLPAAWAATAYGHRAQLVLALCDWGANVSEERTIALAVHHHGPVLDAVLAPAA